MTSNKARLEEARLVYNRITVAVELTLPELIDNLVPLTSWYVDILDETARQPIGAKTRSSRQAPKLPTEDELWEDVARPAKPTYPYPRLLAFIRIAGIVGHLTAHANSNAKSEIESLAAQLRRLGERGVTQPDHSARSHEVLELRKALGRAALTGWKKRLRTSLPLPRGKLIFAIYRNRPALLAMHHSLKTVKADAANRLFTIQCKEITWAVINSGIDASHPAFLDRGKLADQSSDDKLGEQQKLDLSRVIETYDFTHLPELLLGGTLPAQYLQGEGTGDDKLREIELRIQRSQTIDWGLLRPFLSVPYDKNYSKSKPTDSHGTHVAGIIGANWPREGQPIVGMCPDIKLIDTRVCREDGTSEEFIIISALQFLRYLNSISDEIYVHGANMSLSIPYDISAFGCGQTLVCSEADRTVSSGISIIAAAGNFGYRRVLSDNSDTIEEFCPVSITDPGNAERVIIVGSTHRISPHTYGVSYFSSRGPTGDGRIKPDLLAPGEKIWGLAPNSRTLILDGTSMAAPHVSGAAAMLMARHIELRGQPERVKQILCSTATDLHRERHFQGYGLVDVLRALQSV